MNLIDLKRDLTDSEWHILRNEMDRRRRSTTLVYFLWFFLSPFGVHKFYLGKPLKGIVYAVFPAIAGVAFLGGLFNGFRLFLQSGPGQPSVIGSNMHIPEAQAAYSLLAAFVGLVGLLGFAGWWLVDLLTLHRQTERANEELERKVLFELMSHRTTHDGWDVR